MIRVLRTISIFFFPPAARSSCARSAGDDDGQLAGSAVGKARNNGEAAPESQSSLHS
jgi:hypothetical protein